MKFCIVGNTDNTGALEANMTLSEQCAKAVMNELVNNYGVNANQVSACGVSNLCPIASNETDEGEAGNRRVEIVEQKKTGFNPFFYCWIYTSVPFTRLTRPSSSI